MIKSQIERLKPESPELPDIMKSLEQFYMVNRTDSEGSIIYANDNFLDTSKWTPKRILGKTFWQMFPDTNAGQNQAHAIWNSVTNGKTWSGTAEKMTRLSEPYYVSMIAIPFMQAEVGLVSVMLLELDITEDVHVREQLQQIAFIDYETGLMSRYKLETIVNESIAEDRHFSFVYITIDHYYTLKDLQSSESEKELIKSFTNRLKRFSKMTRLQGLASMNSLFSHSLAIGMCKDSFNFWNSNLYISKIAPYHYP